MIPNDNPEINSEGWEEDWDGVKRHVPRGCDLCFKPRSAQYGKDQKWYCLRCWLSECTLH